MDTERGIRLSRRSALRIAGAIVAAGASATGMMRRPRVATAAVLRPGDPLYHFDQYEAIVNRDLTVRQLFQWPNFANAELYANAVNALNAWQFAYDVPPDQVQVVVQAYASANKATYDDYLWNTYQLAAAPIAGAGGAGTSGNPVLHSRIPADQVATPPTDPNDPYYFDSTIEGLQRRGVLFLT